MVLSPRAQVCFCYPSIPMNTIITIFASSRILTSPSSSSRISATALENILSLLERVAGIPSASSAIGNWWVEAFSRRPTKLSQGDYETEHETATTSTNQEEDDWRKFFEESSAPDPTASNTPSARLHTLSIHEHLYSVASHRAVFTRAWLSLLSTLSFVTSERSKAFALRILTIMHRAVIPHLTRPILVMDWVGSCIDYGSFVSLVLFVSTNHVPQGGLLVCSH